jgi:hypothetical protein
MAMEPTMTTPHDERATAELLRKRREMRRHYSQSYESESMHPLPESLSPDNVEPIFFVIRRDEDEEQSAALSGPHAVALQSKWNSGFCHGFVTAIVIVLIATVALLVVGA